MKVYLLTSESLTGLGRPLGFEEKPSINWVKPFDSVETAMAYTETIYVGNTKIVWARHENTWYSQDLGHVMFSVREVELGSIKDVKPMIVDDKIVLDGLKKAVTYYIDDRYSDNASSDDSEWKQIIFEEAMMALYGKDIFFIINKKRQ